MTRPAAGVLLLLACSVATAGAQGIEAAPLFGYRFGGGFFERAAARPVDTDGAPAVGVMLNVPLSEGLQIEALVTHQAGTVFAPTTLLGTAVPLDVSVDHWLGGGLQEFGRGRVRPFTTGMVGLTHYAIEGDSEVRFTVAAGGGVKLFPSANVGVRLDGRLLATFLTVDARLFSIAWQTEFTSAIVLRFR
jgi:hypothetical protein